MADEGPISWLLEDGNPPVRYRTQTELLGAPADKAPVIEWLSAFLPDRWYDTKGLWYRYYITALAECGLTREDAPAAQVEKALDELDHAFDCNCGDYMLLRALVKMGYGHEPVVTRVIGTLKSLMLPDHGFLCLHRVNKLKYTPKSCYKANLHALLFIAECRKRGVASDLYPHLAGYFLDRDIFYRSTDRSNLVLNCRAGWRTIDTFYPFEVMRVGLQNVVEAFCALGLGDDERLTGAWGILHGKRGEGGRYPLDGTLAKSYLPKERVGRSSKWITYYALLAEKERYGPADGC